MTGVTARFIYRQQKASILITARPGAGMIPIKASRRMDPYSNNSTNNRSHRGSCITGATSSSNANHYHNNSDLTAPLQHQLLVRFTMCVQQAVVVAATVALLSLIPPLQQLPIECLGKRSTPPNYSRNRQWSTELRTRSQ